MAKLSAYLPPVLDPRILYRRITWMRKLNTNQVAALDNIVIIQDGGIDPQSIAVLMPYNEYIQLQQFAIEKGSK